MVLRNDWCLVNLLYLVSVSILSKKSDLVVLHSQLPSSCFDLALELLTRSGFFLLLHDLPLGYELLQSYSWLGWGLPWWVEGGLQLQCACNAGPGFCPSALHVVYRWCFLNRLGLQGQK